LLLASTTGYHPHYEHDGQNASQFGPAPIHAFSMGHDTHLS
jgi:hypothetical protein